MQDDYFSDDAATFGDRMAAAREARGFSPSQLASRVGVRLGTVQNWESDRSEPRANKLQMLAGLLNVSIVWLLTGQGEGGVDADDAVEDSETLSLLAELRDIRLGMARLMEKSARVEKRLRAMERSG
ncbi:MAG: helix-turn-helix transcriptional regulator [Pseudomonadota bacterium]